MAVNPSALGQNKGLSELWKRLRFVFMAVIIYRVGTHIPIPGIDPDKLANIPTKSRNSVRSIQYVLRRCFRKNEYHGLEYNALYNCLNNHEPSGRYYTFIEKEI